MKKIYYVLLSLFLLIGCNRDDVYDNIEQENGEVSDTLKGKSFILSQKELFAKYANNKNIRNALEKDFGTNLNPLTTTTTNYPYNGTVEIDLEHIQVVEV